VLEYSIEKTTSKSDVLVAKLILIFKPPLFKNLARGD
jgi:hypothetical protein